MRNYMKEIFLYMQTSYTRTMYSIYILYRIYTNKRTEKQEFHWNTNNIIIN